MSKFKCEGEIRPLTDAIIVLNENLNKLANVRVFKLLHDAYFSRKCGCLRVPTMFCGLRRFDHLNCKPFPTLPMNSSSNGGKRTFSKVVTNIIFCVKASFRQASCHMTIHESCMILRTRDFADVMEYAHGSPRGHHYEIVGGKCRTQSRYLHWECAFGSCQSFHRWSTEDRRSTRTLYYEGWSLRMFRCWICRVPQRSNYGCPFHPK